MKILKTDNRGLVVEHIVGWEEGFVTLGSLECPILHVYMHGGTRIRFDFYYEDEGLVGKRFVSNPELRDEFVKKMEEEIISV
jgi:hypothetical protein